MTKSRLDNTEIKNRVIKELAAGISQTQIANQLGVSQSLISKFSTRKDVRPFIEREQLRLIEVIPDAVYNVKKLVEEMKDIPTNEVARQKLAYKATSDVLKSVGIYPNPVQANSITNIYNDNRKAVISPIVNAVLSE